MGCSSSKSINIKHRPVKKEVELKIEYNLNIDSISSPKKGMAFDKHAQSKDAHVNCNSFFIKNSRSGRGRYYEVR